MKSKHYCRGLIAAVVCGIFVLQGCHGRPKTEGGYRGPAIDTHVHVSIGTPISPIDKSQPEVIRLWTGPEKEAAERVALEMEAANVGMVFLLGQVGVDGDPLGIERSVRVAKELAALPKPKVAKIVAIADPKSGLSGTQMEAVRTQLEKHRRQIVALKCYIGYYGPPTDPGYEPFYRLALEHNLPVMFHTGDPWGPKTRVSDSMPLLLDDVAREFPDLRIVLCHMGCPWHVDAADMMWRQPNVWVDLSGLYVGPGQPLEDMCRTGKLRTIPGSTVMSDLIEALTLVNRYDRVLYASDFPLPSFPERSMSPYRRFIETLIPKEHHEKVFRQNAEQLFGVKLAIPASQDK